MRNWEEEEQEGEKEEEEGLCGMAVVITLFLPYYYSLRVSTVATTPGIHGAQVCEGNEADVRY